MGALLNLNKPVSAVRRPAVRPEPGYLLFSLAMLFIGLAMVFPFIVMLSVSMKTQSTVFSSSLISLPLNWKNYITVCTDPNYINWYSNSICAVATTIVLRLFITTLAAYAFARLSFKGKDAVFLILIATMMITPETTIVPRYLFYKKINLLDSMWVIVLPELFEVFYLFMLRQFMIRIPGELSEAADIDGASHFSIYWRIILPLSKTVMVTVVLFSFIYLWNDFINPYLFIRSMDKQLLTAALKYFQDEAGANIPVQLAGAATSIVPIVILFAATQKYFVEGISTSGIKG